MLRCQLAGILLSLCCLSLACKQNKGQEGVAAKDGITPITKSSIKKLDWTVGNWRCQMGELDFYQLHEYVNDSTIKVLTYKIQGKDSIQSQAEYLRWSEGKIRFGANGAWEATTINENEMYLSPVYPGGNNITWQRGSNKDEWHVTMLNTTNNNRQFQMKRAPALADLLRK